MLDIIFLGTAGSAPTKKRSLPSTYLFYDGDALLFDCGEGTQMQIIKLGLSPNKIRAIFISHIHGDHVIGIAGLVRTLALNNRTEELKIFIPKGFEKAITSLIKFDKAIINYSIKILPIKRGVIFSTKKYQVSAFKLNHTVMTYGFAFSENEKLKFDVQKCKSLGIKGDMFKHLELNGKIIINKNKILLKEVSYKKKGLKVIYATDTRPTKETITNAMHADLLIHESSYTQESIELAKSRKHSTVTEAATIAKTAKVTQLVLTHISARYKDDFELIKEGKSIFKNTSVAFDGMKLQL
ncbi:MAG: ribonuclease Z [Candidatus Micrarchaeia archaeon]